MTFCTRLFETSPPMPCPKLLATHAYFDMKLLMLQRLASPMSWASCKLAGALVAQVSSAELVAELCYVNLQ